MPAQTVSKQVLRRRENATGPALAAARRAGPMAILQRDHLFYAAHIAELQRRSGVRSGSRGAEFGGLAEDSSSMRGWLRRPKTGLETRASCRSSEGFV
jgi:hypothetical protein